MEQIVVSSVVKPLVGPSSILLAMMSSSLNGQNFAFNGYIPIDKDERRKALKTLENRSQKVIVNKSNKNDIIRIFGQPQATSQNEEDTWIYFERILTKGKYHKLGRHIVKENNVLVLEFNKFGIIKNKKLYTKEDINKIAFLEKKTENKLTQKSFVESFLQSVKQKMYKNR